MMDRKQIVSDEEILRVHGNSSFGEMSPREVVDEGVLKYSMGYFHGSRGKAIMEEHGLIRRTRNYNASLTNKGKDYMRCMFSSNTFQEHLKHLGAQNETN